MWALIAFIGLGIVIAVLIEFNERRKAKRPKEDCKKEQSASADCSECSLIEVCDKKSTAAR